MAFVGKNGEGKSALVKSITGLIDYEGTIKKGHNVKIGYYAQNQTDMLDPEKTVFDTIDDAAVGDIRKNIRGILGSFLFGEDDIDKKVKVLSGGEKARLSLAKMLLTPVNLLILDEPTNHLDMVSKDILKNALLQFTGTLILVSHDRDFLRGLSDVTYEFRGGKLIEHMGGIDVFLEKRRLQHLKELETNRNREKQENKDLKKKSNKDAWLARKEEEKKVRKLERAIEKSEEKISSLEEEISLLNEKLADPDKYGGVSNDLFSEYDKKQKELEQEMENWEKLNEELTGEN